LLHENPRKQGGMKGGPSRAKAHDRTPSLVKQRKRVDEVNVGPLVKTPAALQKHKKKEKVPKPIVELNEHLDFHSSKSNGDVNFLIAPLGVSRREKEGKQALECSIVEESLEKQEEEAPKVEESSKEFLAFVDVFCVFVIQQGEAMAQNQEITKLMNHIAEGLGAIDNTPSGGFAKATIK